MRKGSESTPPGQGPAVHPVDDGDPIVAINRCPERLEVIGFGGSPLMPCGRKNALGRDRQTGLCFDLTGYVPGAFAPTTTYTWEEIQDYAAEANATLLAHPRPAPAEPEVLYVTDEMLAAVNLDDDALDRTLRQILGVFDERVVAAVFPHVWAVVASTDTIQRLLTHWANLLMDSSFACAQKCLRYAEQDEIEDAEREGYDAERFADLALNAAWHPDQRWRAYVRLALAVDLSPTWERLANIREFEVRREFPRADLQRFDNALQSARDQLRRHPGVRIARGGTAEERPYSPDGRYDDIPLSSDDSGQTTRRVNRQRQ